MSKFFLVHDTARRNALQAIREAPAGWVVEIKPRTRSTEQNRELWRCCDILSDRVLWDGERLTSEEWKDLMTACLRKQKVVRGVEGGLVFLGAKSSRMDKHEFSDLLDLVHAFAAQRGVDLCVSEAA